MFSDPTAQFDALLIAWFGKCLRFRSIYQAVPNCLGCLNPFGDR